MKKTELVYLNVRLPKRLREEMESLVELGFYTNVSCFVREAIRTHLLSWAMSQDSKDYTPKLAEEKEK